MLFVWVEHMHIPSRSSPSVIARMSEFGKLQSGNTSRDGYRGYMRQSKSTSSLI